MNTIRFRATLRAGNATCRVMEYEDGQTWIAADADGAWWRSPRALSDVECILAESAPGDRVLDVMRRIVPHYNPHLDQAGRPLILAGGFLRATPRVVTQRGWAVPHAKTG